MSEEKRCQSPFCVTDKGLKGRLFTPPANAQGLATVWCRECIRLSNEVKFFTQTTADMIRATYKSYRPDELPENARLVLEQFAREILTELGAEL